MNKSLVSLLMLGDTDGAMWASFEDGGGQGIRGSRNEGLKEGEEP